ncbi:hypothetical protein JIN77_07955 [Verrucomicrobiaceae bacterium R5-34]|uniref:PDZ domain-containing protein n=1 Tax=Oceaniferula flava TaxID=2800421 RepID=A0AAE2SCX7_9BACT|nr:DUF6288 domain-containing protein [Oceaniferula flavus]MBK1830656.1 hypothetical protein [Verrucomicrobiaceae bacterium R5-34]MBK1855916.1 hypothetical protein [Oceaniferula flavus]MBM1137223.1 hypothetical protein [Oceaniferula flavus]
MLERPFVTTVFFLSLIVTSLHAIEKDNRGRWEQPSKHGPDTEVPGFLINLGPTGARATMEAQSFTVKYIFADSPAAGKLALDDVITGVNGRPFDVPHTFGHHMTRMKEFPTVGYEGPMMDFGNAIEEAEGGDGKLILSVTRAGQPIKVTIPLKAIGKFSDTFPLNCPKSALLAKQASNYLSGPGYDYIQKEKVHAKGMSALALLAAGKSAQAKELAHAWNEKPHKGIWVWPTGYQCIFLCEYYLLTKDEAVLPTIQALAAKLEYAQVDDMANYKDRTHGKMGNVGHKFRTGGMGHNTEVGGYGTMNITTTLSLAAWELAKQCGVAVDQKKVDLAFDYLRSSTDKDGYIGYHTKAGAYAAGGRQGLSIVAHHLAGESQNNPEYLKRVTHGLKNSKKYLPDAHADGMLAVCWGLLGTRLCGDVETQRAIMDYNKAWFNMARCHDGSFVALPGRDMYDSCYYLSSRHQLTATMALVLANGEPVLKIQGK